MGNGWVVSPSSGIIKHKRHKSKKKSIKRWPFYGFFFLKKEKSFERMLLVTSRFRLWLICKHILSTPFKQLLFSPPHEFLIIPLIYLRKQQGGDTRHPSAQQQVTHTRNRRLTDLARWPTGKPGQRGPVGSKPHLLVHLRLRLSSARITWVPTGGDDGATADALAAGVAVAAAVVSTNCRDVRGPAPVQRGEKKVLTVKVGKNPTKTRLTFDQVIPNHIFNPSVKS